jgi:hypothetical protein
MPVAINKGLTQQRPWTPDHVLSAQLDDLPYGETRDPLSELLSRALAQWRQLARTWLPTTADPFDTYVPMPPKRSFVIRVRMSAPKRGKPLPFPDVVDEG